MATTQRYLTVENGQKKVQTATQTSTGSSDAGKIPALNNAGKIDPTMLPDSSETADIITASEALGAGSFVNLFKDDTTGTVSVRLADNSNKRVAHGFVKQSVASGELAGVYSLGVVNADLSGLAIGQRYYLGTAGKAVQTPLDETATANKGLISQYLGIAKSEKELMTIQEDSITL